MTSRGKRAPNRVLVMAGGGKRKPRSGKQQQCEDSAKNDTKKSRSDQADVPPDARQEVESLYRLSMPEDFYHLWTFCTEIDPKAPCDALKSILGLQLVGPYDILYGRHKTAKKGSDINYGLHWRFFYDPPEFQTVIVGDDRTQFHMGYFRDSPEELPVFVGANEASKGCTITQLGDNLFAALKQFTSKKLKEVTDKGALSALKQMLEKLTTAAEALGYSLDQKSAAMKRREKKVHHFYFTALYLPSNSSTQKIFSAWITV